jgi:hypothetical protein
MSKPTDGQNRLLEGRVLVPILMAVAIVGLALVVWQVLDVLARRPRGMKPNPGFGGFVCADQPPRALVDGQPNAGGGFFEQRMARSEAKERT